MAKYHLSKDGTPGLCKAEKKACPLGDAPHTNLEDPNELRAWAENQNDLATSAAPTGFVEPFKESGKLMNEGSHYGGDQALTDGWSRRFQARREDGKLTIVTEIAYPIIVDPEQYIRFIEYDGDLEAFFEANPDFTDPPWDIQVEVYREISDPLDSEEDLSNTSGLLDTRELEPHIFTSVESAEQDAKAMIIGTNPNRWYW